MMCAGLGAVLVVLVVGFGLGAAGAWLLRQTS
jgi:hypothetical protein